MDNPFGVGFWLSEGRSFPPNGALDFLSQQYLTENNIITFPEPQPDIRALLDGFDPKRLVAPDTNIAGILFSKGWGRDGQAEALLFIAQNDDGRYVWDTVIIAHYGFDLSGLPRETTEEELLNNFQGVVESTIMERDYNLMRRFMRDEFVFGFWRSTSLLTPSNDVIEQLRNNYIGHSHGITFSEPPPNFNQTLGVQDLGQVWGSDTDVVRSVYSDKGWGSDGQGAAILGIAQDSDGTYYWYGVIIAPNGF